MSSIRLVCFDLGRVLVRICENWQHACQIAQVPARRGELDDTAKRAVHEIVCAHEVGRINHEQFCQQMSPHLGIDAGQVRAMSDHYLLSMYPGVLEMLDDLTLQAVETACLSNTNASHWKIMSNRLHPAAM